MDSLLGVCGERESGEEEVEEWEVEGGVSGEERGFAGGRWKGKDEDVVVVQMQRVGEGQIGFGERGEAVVRRAAA